MSSDENQPGSVMELHRKKEKRNILQLTSRILLRVFRQTKKKNVVHSGALALNGRNELVIDSGERSARAKDEKESGAKASISEPVGTPFASACGIVSAEDDPGKVTSRSDSERDSSMVDGLIFEGSEVNPRLKDCRNEMMPPEEQPSQVFLSSPQPQKHGRTPSDATDLCPKCRSKLVHSNKNSPAPLYCQWKVVPVESPHKVEKGIPISRCIGCSWNSKSASATPAPADTCQATSIVTATALVSCEIMTSDENGEGDGKQRYAMTVSGVRSHGHGLSSYADGAIGNALLGSQENDRNQRGADTSPSTKSQKPARETVRESAALNFVEPSDSVDSDVKRKIKVSSDTSHQTAEFFTGFRARSELPPKTDVLGQPKDMNELEKCAHETPEDVSPRVGSTTHDVTVDHPMNDDVADVSSTKSIETEQKLNVGNGVASDFSDERVMREVEEVGAETLTFQTFSADYDAAAASEEDIQPPTGAADEDDAEEKKEVAAEEEEGVVLIISIPQHQENRAAGASAKSAEDTALSVACVERNSAKEADEVEAAMPAFQTPSAGSDVAAAPEEDAEPPTGAADEDDAEREEEVTAEEEEGLALGSFLPQHKETRTVDVSVESAEEETLSVARVGRNGADEAKEEMPSFHTPSAKSDVAAASEECAEPSTGAAGEEEAEEEEKEVAAEAEGGVKLPVSIPQKQENGAAHMSMKSAEEETLSVSHIEKNGPQEEKENLVADEEDICVSDPSQLKDIDADANIPTGPKRSTAQERDTNAPDRENKNDFISESETIFFDVDQQIVCEQNLILSQLNGSNDSRSPLKNVDMVHEGKAVLEEMPALRTPSANFDVAAAPEECAEPPAGAADENEAEVEKKEVTAEEEEGAAPGIFLPLRKENRAADASIESAEDQTLSVARVERNGLDEMEKEIPMFRAPFSPEACAEPPARAANDDDAEEEKRELTAEEEEGAVPTICIPQRRENKADDVSLESSEEDILSVAWIVRNFSKAGAESTAFRTSTADSDAAAASEESSEPSAVTAGEEEAEKEEEEVAAKAEGGVKWPVSFPHEQDKRAADLSMESSEGTSSVSHTERNGPQEEKENIAADDDDICASHPSQMKDEEADANIPTGSKCSTAQERDTNTPDRESENDFISESEMMFFDVDQQIVFEQSLILSQLNSSNVGRTPLENADMVHEGKAVLEEIRLGRCGVGLQTPLMETMSTAGGSTHPSEDSSYTPRTHHRKATPGCLYHGNYDKDGLYHGNGELMWENGDRYVGKFEHGMRHGMGKLFFADGSQYDGWWRQNRMHGHGTRTSPDGSQYVGNFAFDRRNGRGQYIFANGDLYVGNFRDDEMDGSGLYYFHNEEGSNETFEGTFRGGRRHGWGRYHWADGKVDIVRYVNDERVGKGVRYSADRKKAWKINGEKVKGKISLKKAQEVFSSQQNAAYMLGGSF